VAGEMYDVWCSATTAGGSAPCIPGCLHSTRGMREMSTPAQIIFHSQIIDGDSFLLQAIGSGLWPAMVLLSEIVQTFILADFW
jgi:hypothetical protein